MKSLIPISAVLLAGCASLSYQPAGEQTFSRIASQGCNDRNGDVMVRAQVSKAYENTVVLSDPADSQSTMSVTLPGRGPVARFKGLVGTSKYEASRQRLNELGAAGTPVMITLECQGGNAPLARNISYTNQDGSRGAITF